MGLVEHPRRQHAGKAERTDLPGIACDVHGSTGIAGRDLVAPCGGIIHRRGVRRHHPDDGGGDIRLSRAFAPTRSVGGPRGGDHFGKLSLLDKARDQLVTHHK